MQQQPSIRNTNTRKETKQITHKDIVESQNPLNMSPKAKAVNFPQGTNVHMDKRIYVVSSLFAGIGSGTVASVICAPLDLIRTRMQVLGGLTIAKPGVNGGAGTVASELPSESIYQTLQTIVKKDGVKGCFRGLSATMLTVPAFWGMYFPLYEECKSHLHELYNDKNEHDHFVHMTSAVLAGGISDFTCNPMFVIRTRMQTEALHMSFNSTNEIRKPLSIARTAKSLYSEAGFFVFWRGLTASLMGLSHVAIQFPVYEWLKAEARKRNDDNVENPLDLLLASGMSKVCATTLAYPHEVIRSRMMDARGNKSVNVLSTSRTIVRNEGYRGLYKGLNVALIRVVPNCCITFMTYEMLLRWCRGRLID